MSIVRLIISRSEDWIARGQDEDFGIDLELELASPAVRGEIVKVQVKSHESVQTSTGAVSIRVNTKYLRYAEACRYPVVFVWVDNARECAWWLWLQRWVLENERSSLVDWRSQSSVTVRVPTAQTLSEGLRNELKQIARWEGESQLVLSLLDCVRAVTGSGNTNLTSSLAELVAAAEPSRVPIDLVVRKAVELGNSLRGTLAGLQVSRLLYALCRECGSRFDGSMIKRMVCREEAYSRAGINGLGILYDEHYEHVSALQVEHLFDDPRVRLYCALREQHPHLKSPEVIFEADGFESHGLRVELDDRFLNRWANRGDSALLDCLVSAADL